MCRRDIGVCVLPPAAPFEDPAGVGIGGVKPVYRYGRPAAPNDPVVRRRSVPSLATAAEDCAAVMAREREGRGERSVCAPKWPICTGPFPCCRRKRDPQLLGTTCLRWNWQRDPSHAWGCHLADLTPLARSTWRTRGETCTTKQVSPGCFENPKVMQGAPSASAVSPS